MDRIIEAVIETTGVSRNDLFGSSRSRKASHARHIAWYLIYPSKTMEEIAELFGKKHPAVWHGIKRVKDEIRFLDNETKYYVSQIKKKLDEKRWVV